MKIPLESIESFKPDNKIDPYLQLIEVMRVDLVINEQIKKMLNLDSYNRRLILNNWVEKLRKQKASAELMQALSCLFDDAIAKETLLLLKKGGII